MGKKATLKEAARILGPPFTETELRRGALQGKYPFMRVGGPRGKIIFDMELLEDRIQDLMNGNLKTENIQESNFMRKVR